MSADAAPTPRLRSSGGEEHMSIPGFTAETAVDGSLNTESVDGSMSTESEGGTHARHRISVLGLVSKEVGLGDVVARIASVAGISPCGGCRRRAQALNTWVSFAPRR
jgi:hypothetical protein